jgi:hypothetical protein
LSPGQFIDVTVLGVAGVPATGVAAVVLNATVAEPSEGGFVTIYPTGGSLPDISSLNFDRGQVVANLVTVPVGDGGKVTAYSPFGRVHLLFDVAGYYATDTGPEGMRFHPVEPTRLVDTRLGLGGRSTRLGAGGKHTFQISGRGEVPASGVGAVALNITVTQTTAPSYLSVYPADVALPDISNLNYGADTTRANQVIVRLSSDGRITVFNAAGSTHVIIDVVGYYDGVEVGEEGRFVPLEPYRGIDTRVDSPFEGTGSLPPESMLLVLMPDEASAYVMNITVTGTLGAGFVTAFPALDFDSPVPAVSNLNYGPGQTVPNHAIIPTGPDLGFYNSGGTVHLILDVFGAFT